MNLDKYYTKSSTVNLIKEWIINNININNNLIIEPSAGNGSFINMIKELSNNYLFVDISPEHNEIKKLDYLELNIDNLKNSHVIGNPPFGKQSSLAIKFIKKSCEFCDSFSFILPKSFKKDSLKKHVDKYFHLIFEHDIPDNSFIYNNCEYNVPCVFQIWKKMDYEREKVQVLEPLNYKFVKKDENPDISFRRVGVNAGNIDINYQDKSIQSHYFIKFENVLNDEILSKLNNLNNINE